MADSDPLNEKSANLKDSLKRFPSLTFLVRMFRKLARPGRFLVWHTPHEPFRSELIQSVRASIGEPFLDLGSGKRRMGAGFVHIDVDPESRADIRSTAADLPFGNNTFGLVWFEAVLEHVSDPERTVAEIGRVLKPDGVVYVEIPFMQGYHADPGDYQRFTVEGLMRLFRQFEIEWVRPCSGPASAFAYIGASFGAILFSCGSAWLYKILFHYVFAYLFWPIKFLDRWLIRHPESHRIAFGYALLARKQSLPRVDSETGSL